jgi:hypothetical protein
MTVFARKLCLVPTLLTLVALPVPLPVMCLAAASGTDNPDMITTGLELRSATRLVRIRFYKLYQIYYIPFLVLMLQR